MGERHRCFTNLLLLVIHSSPRLRHVINASQLFLFFPVRTKQFREEQFHIRAYEHFALLSGIVLLLV